MKIIFLLLLYCTISFSQKDSNKITSQNPSPMVEHTRMHQRITQTDFKGLTYTIDNFLNKPITIYKGSRTNLSEPIQLVIHFHGNADIVKYAVEKQDNNIVAAIINLGAGSKIYFENLSQKEILEKLIEAISNKLSDQKIKIGGIHLSGFSAGYGAIKAILLEPKNFEIINSVLLLDGIHTSYIPERKVLFEGGAIDSNSVDIFLRFAKSASQDLKPTKKFLITHSEIFPGTYASTTEVTDYIIHKLGLKREPVLKWGPLGMQQLSEVKKNNFLVLGFAGNTAPDHIDHLHSLFFFLNEVLK